MATGNFQVHFSPETTMRIDVAGRVRNTQVPRSRPLLPVLEAVVNSFQSIIEAGNAGSASISVVVERSPSTVPEVPGDITAVSIEDNGVGFDERNFESFCVADSRYKTVLGGKGVGRFTWLVVFEKAEIDSIYGSTTSFQRRFVFTASDEFESTAKPRAVALQPRRTVVRLVTMRDGYNPSISPEQIAVQLVEHCLLMLTAANAPSLTLVDGGTEINLNAFCTDYVGDRAERSDIEVRGKRLRLLGLRIYEDINRQHKIYYSAHGRPVTSERLERFIPNLQGSLVDEAGERFVFQAFVEGPFLDENVNAWRTDFNIDKTDDENVQAGSRTLLPEPTLDLIRETAVQRIESWLSEPLAKINETKRARIESLVGDRPQYRMLLPYLDEFIDRIPPTVTNKKLDELLNDELHVRKVNVREETSRTLLALDEEDSAEQQAAVQNIMARLTEIEMSALAEYVANRRVILEYLDKCLRLDPATGRHKLERTLHSIVFPMRTTSEEIYIDNQNLWLIDERLNYHVYLASDKRLSSMKPLDSSPTCDQICSYSKRPTRLAKRLLIQSVHSL